MRQLVQHSIRQRAVMVIGRVRYAPLLAVAALVFGCSASDPESFESRGQAATAFANDKTAYDYFLGKGLTNFQAAAVVGNLDQESGVNPTISQAGGGVGRGIAQWSAGARWDTTKNDNVQAYATEHGQEASSLALQLDFMWYELTTFPEYGLAELKASTTLEVATQVFEDKYEGCVYANYPECALPSRINFAKAVFKAYGADVGQGGGGGAASSGGVSAGGSAGAGGASAGGSPSASGGGGALESGGAPSAAGSSGVAGSSTSAAGGATASVAGSPSAAGSSAAATHEANDPSSCALSPLGRARSTSRASLGAFVTLLAGLSMLRRARRLRVSCR